MTDAPWKCEMLFNVQSYDRNFPPMDAETWILLYPPLDAQRLWYGTLEKAGIAVG